jgi:hypothetical protein
MGLQCGYHSETLSINLDPVKTSVAPDRKIGPMLFYWQGRYIEFCDPCRHTHPALKGIPDQALTRIELWPLAVNPATRRCALGDHPLLRGAYAEQ